MEGNDAMADEPIVLFSELDDDRHEVRKFEIFGDGSAGRASRDTSVGQTVLGELPIPSLEEINSDSQFQGEEITQSEFEAAWSAMNDEHLKSIWS
jgi:hypothetical protein